MSTFLCRKADILGVGVLRRIGSLTQIVPFKRYSCSIINEETYY